MNHARGQHHADGEGVQGLEKLRRLQPPAVHRLPGDAHALPLEDAFQAVQRQMVGPLADDHLGHQARSGQRAGDRFGRLGGQHHVLLRRRQAAFGQLFLAGVFLADMHRDEQGRRPPVQLLAGLRRQLDQVLHAAQGRLLGVGQVVNLFLPLDGVGNPPATVLVAVLAGRRCRGRSIGRGRRRLRRSCLRTRLHLEQRALPRIELLARAAVDAFQQEVHVMLLPGQTLIADAQFCQQLYDERLQHGNLVGQRSGIGKRQGVHAHAQCYAPDARLVRAIAKNFSGGSRRALIARLPLHAGRVDAPQQERQLLA